MNHLLETLGSATPDIKLPCALGSGDNIFGVTLCTLYAAQDTLLQKSEITSGWVVVVHRILG